MPSDNKKIVNILFNLVDKASKGLNEIALALNKVEKVSDTTSKRSKIVSKELNNIGKNAKKAASETQKMGNNVKKSSTHLKGFTGLLKSSNTSLTSLSVGLAALGTAMVAPFALAVSKAGEFEQTMATVQAVSGATAEEFTKLSNIALEMGRTTRYTASEAAEGLKYMSMAGLSAVQSTEALPSVLQLAQAGMMDLGRAADITTNIMTGYGMQASDLGHVNDVLVKAFTSSNSTLEELGTAFTYVGPIAKGVGADFEELVATLGLLHNAGIKGSMAGTALRGALDALMNPTSQEAELMNELSERIGGAGLQIKDTEGNFVGFAKVIEQLEMSGIRADEALKLFGQRAGPGMTALLSQGSAELKKFNGELDSADGTAQDIAKTMDATFQGAMKRLTSAFDGLFQSIGKNIIPVLAKLADGLAWVINGITDLHNKLSEKLGPAMVVFELLAASVAGLVVGFGALALSFSVLSGPISVFLTAMTAAGGLIPLITGAITTLTGAITTLIAGALTPFISALSAAASAVVAFLATNPIGWAILAVGAIGGAVGAYKLFGDSLEEVTKKQEKASREFEAAGKKIEDYQKKLKNLEKGSKEYKDTNLALRKELEKFAEENEELENKALRAAYSIDAITGNLKDNGKAIEELKSAALAKEFESIGKKGEALEKTLENMTDGVSFKELKDEIAIASEEMGYSVEHVKRMEDAVRKYEAQASRVIEKLIATGEIDVFDNTSEDVLKIAESLGIVTSESEEMQQAVSDAFNVMKKEAVENADKTVDALNGVVNKSQKELEARMKITNELSKQFAKEMVENVKYIGDETVTQYSEMFNAMDNKQKESFLKRFKTHETELKKTFISSRTAAEKEVALAESKKKLIAGIEKDIADEAAKVRIKGYEKTVDYIDNFWVRQLNSTNDYYEKELALAVGNDKKIETLKNEHAEKLFKINIDGLAKQLAAAKKNYYDLVLLYGAESEEAKKQKIKINEYTGEIRKYKTQEYDRITSHIKSKLKEGLEKEKEYADKVKKYTNEIKDIKTSAEDRIREIRRKGMTDAQKQNDIEKQAAEKLIAAKHALAEGDKDRAKELAKQSEDIAAGLDNERKAIQGIEEASKFRYEVAKEQKEENEKALKAQKEGNEALKKSMDDVVNSIERLINGLIRMHEIGGKPLVIDTNIYNGVDKLSKTMAEMRGQAEKPWHMDVETVEAINNMEELGYVLNDVQKQASSDLIMQLKTDNALINTEEFAGIIGAVKADITSPIGLNIDTQYAQQQLDAVDGKSKQVEQGLQHWSMQIEVDGAMVNVDRLGNVIEETKTAVVEPVTFEFDPRKPISSIDQLQGLTNSLLKDVEQQKVFNIEATQASSQVGSLSGAIDNVMMQIQQGGSLNIDSSTALFGIDSLKSKVSETFMSLQQGTELNINAEGVFTTIDTIKQLLQTISDTPIDIKMNDTQAKIVINELTKPTQSTHTVIGDTTAAQTAIDLLKQNTSSVHTVYIQKVEQNATGGIAGQGTGKAKFATGGRNLQRGSKLPGFGSTDVVEALLTWGERIINSKSTRAIDTAYPGLMDAANRTTSASGIKDLFKSAVSSREKFATGGVVGATSGSVSTTNTNNNGITVNTPITINAEGSNSQDMEKMFREDIVPRLNDAINRNTGNLTTILKRTVGNK